MARSALFEWVARRRRGCASLALMVWEASGNLLLLVVVVVARCDFSWQLFLWFPAGMPPSKFRIIEVEEGESVFLKVKSMYPITIEFQKGTLVAFEVQGGIFTRFGNDRPKVVEKVEEIAETQHEDDFLETQPFDYGLEKTPPPTPRRKDPPPHNVTLRKSRSARKASPMPLDMDGETQLEYTQLDI